MEWIDGTAGLISAGASVLAVVFFVATFFDMLADTIIKMVNRNVD
jgi:hypothetical protein